MKIPFDIQFFGSGSWDTRSYTSYAATKKRTVTTGGFSSTQEMFMEKTLHKNLDPLNAIRECCDSDEHPNTLPVILALDVTGSMGSSCERTAASLNVIMTDLYKNYTDVEFLIMGIGDLSYDRYPIQASQFESDVRIAEQVDQIYMEKGGGGNAFESYTSAWFFGLHHTKLDCWKRGKKGIIITMGDEPLNPYLPHLKLSKVLGDPLQGDIETNTLYEEAKAKFDIYHIAVDDSHNSYHSYKNMIDDSFGKLLGNHLKIATIKDLPQVITACISESISNQNSPMAEPVVETLSETVEAGNGDITW